MKDAKLILALDTSGPYCAAVLWRDKQVLASACEEMARGQAERLMPILDGLLQDAGKSWGDLGRIGVGIGPGNFTGIRIAVSTARGLSLGLGIPAIGVDSFDAIDAVEAYPGAACVPAPRRQGYLKAKATGAPYLASEAELSDISQDVPLHAPQAGTIALGIARVAATREDGPRPAPLYVKPADAAPSRETGPVILDDA